LIYVFQIIFSFIIITIGIMTRKEYLGNNDCNVINFTSSVIHTMF